MADVTLHPGGLSGVLQAPPSKSAAHRAIICAALAAGESEISPVDTSQDMEATLACMAALGAGWEREGDLIRVTGLSGAPHETPVLDCRESGSTLRFVMPLALALSGGGTFLTKGRLKERPLGPYEALFSKQGIRFERTESGFLVQGPLSPGEFTLPGNVSSQFVTGLLLSLPLLNGDSLLRLTGPLESEGYVQLTLDVLADFGVTVRRPDPMTFPVPGGQSFCPRRYQVEGDYSQAAVFLCAGALGSDIGIKGLHPHSLQGDRAVIGLLQSMGAGFVKAGDTVFMRPEKLRGIRLDGGQIPDILPMLALTLCLAEGESRIENAGRLRLKECDRLAATVEELSKLGADIRAEGDSLFIRGVPRLLGGAAVDSHNDHRMAMMLSIAALHCVKPVRLTDPACVAKSWPGYWEAYQGLGGKIA